MSKRSINFIARNAGKNFSKEIIGNILSDNTRNCVVFLFCGKIVKEIGMGKRGKVQDRTKWEQVFTNAEYIGNYQAYLNEYTCEQFGLDLDLQTIDTLVAQALKRPVTKYKYLLYFAWMYDQNVYRYYRMECMDYYILRSSSVLCSMRSFSLDRRLRRFLDIYQKMFDLEQKARQYDTLLKHAKRESDFERLLHQYFIKKGNPCEGTKGTSLLTGEIRTRGMKIFIWRAIERFIRINDLKGDRFLLY